MTAKCTGRSAYLSHTLTLQALTRFSNLVLDSLEGKQGNKYSFFFCHMVLVHYIPTNRLDIVHITSSNAVLCMRRVADSILLAALHLYLNLCQTTNKYLPYTPALCTLSLTKEINIF